MVGIKPCPACGGEVEVVKLPKRKNDTEAVYRIECLKCRKLVARGIGFPGEPKKIAEERIREYEAYIDRTFGHNLMVNSRRTHGNKTSAKRDYI